MSDDVHTPFDPREEIIRLLIGRLTPFEKVSLPMDFGRIEELCWLISEVLHRPADLKAKAVPPPVQKPADWQKQGAIGGRYNGGIGQLSGQFGP